LAILNDVHRTLATSITRDDLLDTILDRVFNHLRPEQAAIFLKSRDGNLERVAGRTTAAEDDFVVSQKLSAEVVGRGMAALVHDLEVDHRFADAQSLIAAGIRSVLAAPLADPSGTLGMIVLGSSARVRFFNEDDMELLSSLASVAALRIRNLALAEEAAERRRLQREVALARVIQNALIPDKLPSIPGYELYGANLPSQGVSGDYFEVSERRKDDECALLIADVSGKGIAASLLTAYLEALTAPAIEIGLAPEQVFVQVSTRLFRRTPPERFATALLVIVEPATGRLRYANAGHNPALLLRADGTVEYLEGTGAPLGLLPLAEYRGVEMELGRGDTLVLYTDGYTEAVDPADDEFGLERLEALCRTDSHLPLGELATALNAALDSFVDGVPFADDRTLVMLRRSP
jgi:phosphoserine phosphatase RsbU/P